MCVREREVCVCYSMSIVVTHSTRVAQQTLRHIHIKKQNTKDTRKDREREKEREKDTHTHARTHTHTRTHTLASSELMAATVSLAPKASAELLSLAFTLFCFERYVINGYET